MAPAADCDVLVAGLGPVGQLLGNLLGAAGVSVVAVDPAAGPSEAPRAATTDDEVLRILQGAGLDGAVSPHLAPQPGVTFAAADGRRLALLTTPATGPNGHPPLAAWHQPGLERVLSAGLARFASVDARWGAGVRALAPDAGGVTVGLAGGERVRARWVVGCDGAASSVRRLAGIGFRGSTSPKPWLVVDAELDGPLPGVDRVCFVGDPQRPAVTLPIAPGRHRWEFMSSAEEDHAALAAPHAVCGLLEPWLGGAVEARVVRRAVYTFHARMAERWRAGRILLAGDAAHVMPPFAGQGLAAGARDAHNLAWKLTAALAGAPEALLDTYEVERRPEVRAATRIATAWGAVLQTRRPRLARARDAALFAVDATPVGAALRRRARPQPALRGGCVMRPGRRGAGALFPQPHVVTVGRRVRLDDALGAGWAVLGHVSGAEAAAWTSLGARVPALEDADGAVAAWLARHRSSWVALRPDRYVFARGRAGEAGRAAAAAAAWLGAA